MSNINRIEWIDTVKGIAIILIILEHTTCIDSKYIGIVFTQITLPAFFALSGYFFKSSTSFKSFILSKISSLIIPTLFFFWGACLIYWMMQKIGVKFVIPFNWIYALDIFNPSEKIYCNGVVWFLIALFWVNCMFYLLNKNLSLKYQLFIVFFCGLGGVLMPIWNINLPYFFDSSLTALPFFMMGYLLRFYSYYIDKYKIYITLLSLLWLAFFSTKNSMRSNSFEAPLLYHITSLFGITTIVILCRYINNIPVISNIYGRYSLIVLCTHPLLINPIRRFSIVYLNGNEIFTFLLVTILEIIIAPVVAKLFPYFTAQKKIIVTTSSCRL